MFREEEEEESDTVGFRRFAGRAERPGPMGGTVPAGGPVEAGRRLKFW